MVHRVRVVDLALHTYLQYRSTSNSSLLHDHVRVCALFYVSLIPHLGVVADFVQSLRSVFIIVTC